MPLQDFSKVSCKNDESDSIKSIQNEIKDRAVEIKS